MWLDRIKLGCSPVALLWWGALLAIGCGGKAVIDDLGGGATSSTTSSNGSSNGSSSGGDFVCGSGGAGAASPALLASDSSVAGIAVDELNVYWTQHTTGDGPGKVMALAKSGTAAPLAIATGQLNPYFIVLDDETVYWTNADIFGSIMRIAKDGSDLMEVVVANGFDLAVDEINVYWTSLTDQTVGQAAKDGAGPVVTLASEQVAPTGLAVGGGYVYWESLGHIRRVTVGGGPIETLTTDAAGLRSAAIDQDYIYWASVLPGGIWKLSLSGGEPIELAPIGAANAIAVDSQCVYWATDSAIYEAPLAGGVWRTLASPGQTLGHAIALDETSVYWSSAGVGVMNVAK